MRLKNNKKGFVFSANLIIGIIAILVILALIIGLSISSTVRIFTIGAIILGFAMFLIAKMDSGFAKTTIIIALFGGGFLIIFMSGVLQEQFTGTSILSIDKVDNVGVGENFLVYGSAGSGSDRIRIDDGEFKEEINSRIEGEGYMIDRGIPIDITLEERSYSFPISPTGKNFNAVRIQDTAPYIGNEVSCDLSDCTRSEVPQMGNYILAYAYSDSWYSGRKCKCLYYESLGQAGEFSSNVEQLDFILRFDVDSQSRVMTNSNPFISMMGGNFKAEYVGNLGGSTQLSSPDYQVMIVNGQPQYLIQENADGYRGIDNPKSHISGCIGPSVDTTQDTDSEQIVEICVDEYTRDLNLATDYKTDDYQRDTNGDVSFESNTLLLENPSADFRPQFKMIIDAEWVGLEELAGEPNIVSCASDVEIDNAESKQVQLRVRNDGDNQGYFVYNAVCDNGIRYTASEGITVNKGDTRTFTTSISGRTLTQDDLDGGCTHTFTDLKSGKKDSCVNDVKIRHTEDVCSPGVTRCNPDRSNELQQCNALGTDWVLLKTCGEECIAISGTSAECKGEGPAPQPQSCVEDSDCKENYICVSGSCVYNPAESCDWYEESYTITEKDYGKGYWRAIVPFVEPEEYQVQKCRIKPEFAFGAYILFLGGLVFIAYLYYNEKKVKGGKKKNGKKKK